MDWIDSVQGAILRSSLRHNSSIVTRQNLIKEELDRIESETHTTGQTPAQTLSRILQDLRKIGFIKFLGRGEYEILDYVTPPKVIEPPIQNVVPQKHKPQPIVLSIDIGEPSATERKDVTTTRIIRDTKIVHQLKEKYQYCCQICGETVDLGSRVFAEAHHIQPLGKPHSGPDHESNIIVVCPNHHVMLDFGAIELILGDLKLLHHSIAEEYVEYHNSVVMADYREKR